MRSSGWNVLLTQVQTAGRHASMTRVRGSQPQRPRPVERRRAIVPAIRKNQPRYPILTVAAAAPAANDQVLMVGNAVEQRSPMVLSGGKGTACPMWPNAAMPPESSGYRGAVTRKPCGKAQASCPWAIAQVLKTDS